VTLADVNVLLAAFFSDHPHHTQCATWLHDEVNAGAAFGVSPQVLSSVLRLATHPRVRATPATLAETLTFTEAVLSAPNAVVVQPGAQHWRLFTDLLQQTKAKANLVPDAWFAALAIEHACTWVTLDRDYGRFRGLRVETP
jgi:toxin-antitoxin system PIN domain toxin